jgi:hypothetical protein
VPCAAAPGLPQVDEVVMVQVKQIQEMGAYVKLVSNLFYRHPVKRADPWDARSSSTTTSRE